MAKSKGLRANRRFTAMRNIFHQCFEQESELGGVKNKEQAKQEAGSIRICPRKSFAKWTEEVKCTSGKWTKQ